MDLRKQIIKKCIKSHSKELDQGSSMVGRAQKLEKLGRYEQALRNYEQAKIKFNKALIIAKFIGDTEYQAQANSSLDNVNSQIENLLNTDFYGGVMDN